MRCNRRAEIGKGPIRRHCRSILGVVLLAFSLPLAAQVERTELPGPDRFRLQTTLPVAVDQLLPLLERPCHVRRWMPKLQALRTLARPAPTRTLVYMAQDATWPLKGRDAVVLFERHPGEPLVLSMRGRPGERPQRQGYVRMPLIEGSWSLHRRGDSTLVVYRQRIDPGGRLPQWLADRQAPSRMEAALAALKAYVRNPQRSACPADGPAVNGGG